MSLDPGTSKELMLTVARLPFPPLPVTLEHIANPYSVEVDKDTFNAFEMAVMQLRHDANTGDRILNSHSVIAAMLLFGRWRPKPANAGEEQARQAIDKEKALRRLQYAVLTLEAPAETTTLYALFLRVTQEWLASYTDAVRVAPVASLETLGHEHELHVVLAHYCYGQGVLFSQHAFWQCEHHARLVAAYEDAVHDAEADADSEAARQLDPAACRDDRMEVAERYSKHSLASLLSLCFTRLLSDCLYGYENAPRGDEARAAALAKLHAMAADLNACLPPEAALVLDGHGG